MGWPPSLPVAQVRIARPTDRLDEVVRFYSEGLGLRIVGRFDDHDGYSGVLLALPDDDHHLEFTSHVTGSACAPPTPDNLLVLYIAERAALDAVVERLAGLGHVAVKPQNPYWVGRSVTVPDPDGWRVVLFHGPGIIAES